MRSLLLCALLLTAAGPAAAQEVSAPAPDELLALSFYVQQKDQASTEAELRRLQLKYPAWKTACGFEQADGDRPLDRD